MSHDKWRVEELERLVEAQNRRLARVERRLKEQAGSREGIELPRAVRAFTQLPRQTWSELAWHPEAIFGLPAATQAHAERLLWPRVGR